MFANFILCVLRSRPSPVLGGVPLDSEEITPPAQQFSWVENAIQCVDRRASTASTKDQISVAEGLAHDGLRTCATPACRISLPAVSPHCKWQPGPGTACPPCCGSTPKPSATAKQKPSQKSVPHALTQPFSHQRIRRFVSMNHFHLATLTAAETQTLYLICA